MFKGSDTVSLTDNNPALMAREKYLGEKALHLRIVEEFLTQMELSLLKVTSDQFDFAPVRSAINELRGLADDDNPDRRKRVEFQLAHELLGWQEHLAARDETIEAYHIRRYCDGLKKPFENEVFLALARFYRDIPRCKNSQSKFDLALTRAFSNSVSDLYRSMTMSRDEISVRLAALYSGWDRVTKVDAGSPRDVSGFDKFLAESDELLDFRSLTASRLFDRIREYKGELGDKFWDPAVAAAAVECNIVVGNHLNGLMARANENLGERLGSEFDVAGAFQDTSPNSGTYISEVLKEIDDQNLIVISDSEMESEDLRFLRSLLELTESLTDADSDGNEATPQEIVESMLSIDRAEFHEMISALSHHNPDVRPLSAFIAATDLGSGFELDDFLFDENDQPDEVGREVLEAIFSLESLRHDELHERKMLTFVVKNKVMQILTKAEGLGTKMEQQIAEHPQSAGRRLKIANRLLEARLRTERSIVKFTSRGLGAVPAKKVADDDFEDQKPSFVSLSANRWVVGATLAAIIVSGILLFSAGKTEASLGDDVEVLEAVRLPGGKSLSSAYREGNTLYIVATDAWRAKPEGEKTEALKDLMTSPTKKPLFKILVIDKGGMPLAEMTENGIHINTVAPAPES
ncbi:MAG: hypothetical protein ABIR33_10310 [Pyrinomonadaceae bacterium]